MKICVLIPIYNEGRKIGEVVHGVKARGLDVLVIDDGGTDGGGEIARREGAVVLRHDARQGKGRSLQRGFRYVLEHGYDGVITMDGDGQHAVEDLDGFLRKAEEVPNSVIAGTRMQDTAGMPFVRRWTNRLMSLIISRICRQTVPDTQCGYRYIGREVLERGRWRSGDYEIETEVLIEASRLGVPILSVPVRTIYDGAVSHIHPWKDTLRFISFLWRTRRRRG